MIVSEALTSSIRQGEYDLNAFFRDRTDYYKAEHKLILGEAGVDFIESVKKAVNVDYLRNISRQVIEIHNDEEILSRGFPGP